MLSLRASISCRECAGPLSSIPSLPAAYCTKYSTLPCVALSCLALPCLACIEYYRPACLPAIRSHPARLWHERVSKMMDLPHLPISPLL